MPLTFQSPNQPLALRPLCVLAPKRHHELLRSGRGPGLGEGTANVPKVKMEYIPLPPTEAYCMYIQYSTYVMTRRPDRRQPRGRFRPVGGGGGGRRGEE